MNLLPISEIASIPFVDHANLSGRTLTTLSFYDGKDWHLWLPAQGRLHKLKGRPAEGFYFGAGPEQETDVCLEFLDFISQRACWRSVIRSFLGLRDDFFNITASLKKFEVLYEVSDNYKTSASRFVVTELEYLFSLCRSVFDLLQEMISAQWDTVKFLDESTEKRSLPKTFSKIVLSDKKIRTAEEISSRYIVPPELAAFYSRSAEFFQTLKTFRDRFVHGGNSIENILVTEKGFAVFETTKPFAGFNVWNEEHKLENGLCSLRPCIAFLVSRTIDACEDYVKTVQEIIEYPPPIVPGMRLYMRGYFSDQLQLIPSILSNCSWWSDT